MSGPMLLLANYQAPCALPQGLVMRYLTRYNRTVMEALWKDAEKILTARCRRHDKQQTTHPSHHVVLPCTMVLGSRFLW